jgi:hypothetical protein
MLDVKVRGYRMFVAAHCCLVWRSQKYLQFLLLRDVVCQHKRQIGESLQLACVFSVARAIPRTTLDENG